MQDLAFAAFPIWSLATLRIGACLGCKSITASPLPHEQECTGKLPRIAVNPCVIGGRLIFGFLFGLELPGVSGINFQISGNSRPFFTSRQMKVSLFLIPSILDNVLVKKSDISAVERKNATAKMLDRPVMDETH